MPYRVTAIKNKKAQGFVSVVATFLTNTVPCISLSLASVAHRTSVSASIRHGAWSLIEKAVATCEAAVLQV